MRTTRGNGRVEGWLAGRRHAKARALLEAQGLGVLLDVGGGDSTDTLGFAGKLVVDPSRKKPFPRVSGMFDGACLLATIEHMTRQEAGLVLDKIRRALRPGARLVVTSPAKHAGGLLRFLAITGWVSDEEIEEHKSAWSQRDLRSALYAAGFENVKSGSFLWGLNQWALATKL